jgi:hypothetical protein
VARMGEGRGSYGFLIGRPECKRPLGRRKRRCDDNIKMDLREVEIDEANWIRLTQDSPVADFCEHGNKASGSIKKAGYCSMNTLTNSFPNNILHQVRKYCLSFYRGGGKAKTN